MSDGNSEMSLVVGEDVTHLDLNINVAVLCAANSPLSGYLLQKLIDNRLKIDSVILDSRLWRPEVLDIFAERTGNQFPEIPLPQFEKYRVPCYHVKSLSSGPCIDLITEKKIGILVNGGIVGKLDAAFISAPGIGVLNSHPGFLPEFRGCSCPEWAIFFDKQIGISVHFMSEQIDEGPVILREGLTFRKGDSYADVRTAIYEKQIHLLAKGAMRVIERNLTPDKLRSQEGGTYYKSIDAERLKVVKNKIEKGEYSYQI